MEKGRTGRFRLRARAMKSERWAVSILQRSTSTHVPLTSRLLAAVRHCFLVPRAPSLMVS